MLVSLVSKLCAKVPQGTAMNSQGIMGYSKFLRKYGNTQNLLDIIQALSLR